MTQRGRQIDYDAVLRTFHENVNDVKRLFEEQLQKAQTETEHYKSLLNSIKDKYVKDSKETIAEILDIDKTIEEATQIEYLKDKYLKMANRYKEIFMMEQNHRDDIAQLTDMNRTLSEDVEQLKKMNSIQGPVVLECTKDSSSC